MSESTPAVSVLMPVYNAERYLAESVESVLAQTFTDFELIVVDDGSTDRSLAMLEGYAARDGRVRLVSRPNKGICGTRNDALALARGEFIASLDNDDIALPDRLEKQVHFLREHPEVVCVGGAFEMIDGGGRFLTVLRPPEGDDEIQAEALSGHCSLGPSTAMMRRADVIAAGAWDKTFETTEDIDLWLRMGERGKLANLPDVLSKYRLHQAAASRADRQRDLARSICERAWVRRGIQGEFKATGLWRPLADRKSRYDFLVMYGWWAFQNGQRLTALSYGAGAVKLQPLGLEGWRLLACASLKPMPGPPATPSIQADVTTARSAAALQEPSASEVSLSVHETHVEASRSRQL